MWCYPKRISGNSVAMTESDIKGMLSFTQGFIAVKDVKSRCRKHEMKLLAKEVGVEKPERETALPRRTTTSRTTTSRTTSCWLRRSYFESHGGTARRQSG